MTPREHLQAFANKHGLVLSVNGEVGFGRACVGLLHGNNYVDINPIKMFGDYDYVWPRDERLEAPAGVNAYHKHDCLAVLLFNDDDHEKPFTSEEGLEQLWKWVQHIESHGEVEVVAYNTGAVGIQAMFSGVINYAIRIKQ